MEAAKRYKKLTGAETLMTLNTYTRQGSATTTQDCLGLGRQGRTQKSGCTKRASSISMRRCVGYQALVKGVFRWILGIRVDSLRLRLRIMGYMCTSMLRSDLVDCFCCIFERDE